MITEEENHENRLQSSIADCLREIFRLCDELQLSITTEDLQSEISSSSLLNREKSVRSKVEELRCELRARKSRMDDLLNKEAELCQYLGRSPISPFARLPSLDELADLEAHCKSLQSERDQRRAVFQARKTDIITLMNLMDMDAVSEFEEEVVCEDADTFILSTDRMDMLASLLNEKQKSWEQMKLQASSYRREIDAHWTKLQLDSSQREAVDCMTGPITGKVVKRLHDELERCCGLRRKNIIHLIDTAQKELSELYDMCYIPLASRAILTSTANLDTDDSEEILQRYEVELSRLREWYTKNMLTYEKVSQWKKCWEEFIELERLSTDPSRINNRGGVLLKDEQVRRKLLKIMPTLEKDIISETVSWIGMGISIENTPFDVYAEQKREDFEKQKEKEKTKRQKDKVQVTAIEMKYGSRPAEGARKRTAQSSTSVASASIVPSKLRRADETHGTPRVPRVLTSTMNSSAVPSMKNLAIRRRSNRQNAARVCQVSANNNQYDSTASSRAVATPHTTSSNSAPSRLTSTPYTSAFNGPARLTSTPIASRTTPYSLRHASTAEIIARQLSGAPLTPRRTAIPSVSQQTINSTSKSKGAHTTFKWSVPDDKPVFQLLL